MAARIFLTMVLLTVTVADEFKESCSKECKKFSSSTDFDSYIFMQQYPAGICLTDDNKLITNDSYCFTKWTIHGLWPSVYLKGKQSPPECCHWNQPLDTDLLNQTMLSELHSTWPSLEDECKDEEFWAHEWCTHGTCACAAKATKNEQDYFNSVLVLYNKYNYGNILAQGGIQSDRTKHYNETQIINSVRDQVGAEPYIRCDTYVDDHDLQVLVEMGLCFSKTLQVESCASIKKSECYSHHPVIYPS